MKRYLISMKGNEHTIQRGFEFYTEFFISQNEFWQELSQDDYFKVGEGIYRPIDKENIIDISYIGEI
jgi:hypothetical protein